MGKLDKVFFSAMLALLAMIGLGAYAQTADDLGFFSQVLKYIQDFGGFNWAAKVAGGIFLLTGAMKLSFLDKMWDFLGAYKALVPAILALAAGVISLWIDPNVDVTWAGVLAYLTVGMGSTLINSVLDMVKALPGIGSTVISVIDFLQILMRAQGPKESEKIAAKVEMKKSLAA